MISNQNLSQNVKQLRKERNKNLEEFARESGVSRSTVQEIESGKANVTLDTVDTIAGHLGIPALHLMAGPHSLERKAGKLLDTVELFGALPQDKRKEAVSHFQALLMLLYGGEA